jgi:hypothetical protein
MPDLVVCQRCREPVPAEQLLEHLRLLHPDVDAEPGDTVATDLTEPLPEFWHVNYATLDRNGMYVYSGLIARDRLEANAMARAESLRHGHATITNRAGLVATFVGGRLIERIAEGSTDGR